MSTSIIIPVYNQAEYLPDAIESALGQTETCEVIVVNDGSTDNSLEVAKLYEKHGVKVISQVNKGLSSARNTGIMNATGDYILPLDSDDLLQDNAVERLVVVAETTKADIVASSFKTFEKENGLCVLMPSPSIEDFKVANRIGYCALMRRDMLLDVGGYSSRMTWGYEDYHLWFNLLSRRKLLVTIPDILWLYRVRENSMIKEADAHREELMAQIMKDFPELW